ncbi:MAG: anthranilate phosphoribosyltransferase [Bryobacteraceae bacterium]
MPLLPFLHRIARREHLSADEAQAAMTVLLSAAPSPAQAAALLVALHMKGETADELAGFARAMRLAARRVEVDGPVLDSCGTGGSGVNTFNISTVAAFVIAGAGVKVAKHGNRSITSLCGSADVLEALGIRIDLEPDQIAAAIREVGIGFMLAPRMHPAMAHVQSVRRDLKLRTAFNLLGPLANPAGARFQIIGTPTAEAAALVANALSQLDVDHAYVVSGLDGLDEITTTGPTLVFEVWPGRIEKHLWTPADFGVPHATLEDLTGGDPAANASIARAILGGETGPRRDIVLVNAAAGLMAAGVAKDFLGAVSIAARSIDSGAAKRALDALAGFAKPIAPTS